MMLFCFFTAFAYPLAPPTLTFHQKSLFLKGQKPKSSVSYMILEQENCPVQHRQESLFFPSSCRLLKGFLQYEVKENKIKEKAFLSFTFTQKGTGYGLITSYLILN